MKRNLLKSMLLVMALVLGANIGWAAETEIVKSWDLAAIGKANADKTAFTTFCDGTIKAGSTVCDLGTGVIDGLFAQGGGSWLFRSAGSLYQGNGGGRIFGINNLKAGDVVTIKTNGDYFSGITNAESTFADNTYTWTVTADGMVYGSFARYNYIYSITVEREKSDKPMDPTGKIVAVNGVNRTVALSTETPECEIRYTVDGTEPTVESTLYVEPGIVIAETTTIKAISVKGGVASDVYTAEFEAGTEIKLTAPTYYVSNMTANADKYFATYAFESDNSSVLCKPTATLTATFNGVAVEIPYTATEDGALVVTATAEGYESSSIEVEVKAYSKSVVYDFKSMTADELDAAAWGEPVLGSLRADKWMNDETVHYTVQNDEALSTVFPGLTLGKLGNTMPSLYIGYGLIWGATEKNYATVSATDATGEEIIGVTTNGSYGTKRSTWHNVGSSVNIYRFDTALENINIYIPYVDPNIAAAEADYTKWNDLCAQLTAAMAGNEEYILPDTRMAIETFMSEDVYPTMIQTALNEATENGTDYVSPIDWEALEAMVAEWIAEINGIKNGEIALYTEKGVVTDGTINKAMPFFNTPVDVDVYANNSVVIKGWDGVEGSDLKVVYANVGTLNEEGESRVAIIGLEQTVNGMVVSVPQEDEEDGGVVSVTLMPQAGDYVAFDVQLGEEMTSAMVGTGEETGMGVVSLYGAWYGYPESPTGDDETGDNMGVADAVAAHYMVQWPAEPIVIPAEMLYTAKAETVIDEEWGTLVVDPMRDITVEVYDDNSVIIRAVGGVEGYDLKVAYDAEENVTALTSIVNGKENTYTNGYANIYTDKGKYFTAYIAEGYCYAGEEDGEGYVLLSVFNQNSEWGYDYYIGWPQATVYTLAELKAIEVGEEDPGLEVNVYLDNAKVTLFSTEQGLGFIQDDEVGVILGAFDDIEGLEAGKAITGTVAGGWMNYGYGPMFVITDASEAEFTDAEATPKAIATFDDLATEDCRLVKITNTEATPIIVEDETIYIGDEIMVGDLFDEPFDVPEIVKSVTGIYAMGAMLYIRTADDIEGITDGIKNIAKENAANGAIFNLAGQKVNANFKGIVIKNGKKALVK